MTTSQFQQQSTKAINSLDPRLIDSAYKVMDQCMRAGIPVVYVWGRRTVLEQNLLYRHGRTVPGPVLTRHRGGFSAHNYGLALDFCLFKQGQLINWDQAYGVDRWYKQWMRIVRWFEAEGWISKWRSIEFEPGHVENLFDQTIGQLYEQRRRDEDRHNWDSYLGEPIQDQDIYL